MRALGLEQGVVWTGMLEGDEKWGAFRAADAFILPSHQENFGISVAEALSCGVPTLITDKVNIWSEVAGAGAGFVETDTVAGAAAMLNAWLRLDQAEKLEMRTRARSLFSSKFDISRAAQALLDVISSNGITAPEPG